MFGQRLKETRKAHHYTLESLADIGATGDPAQAKAAMLAAIQQVQAHG